MLETIKKKNLSPTMIKHFILVSLLYPLCGSSLGSPFAPDVVYANIFVAAFIALAWLEGGLDWKRKSWLVYGMAFFLVGFNVISLYVNAEYFGWYAGQLNLSLAFLFLMAWLMMKDSAPAMGEDLIRFLLMAGVITNLIGIVPYIFGNQTVQVTVFGYRFLPMGTGRNYSWIYQHKSEYSFVLVLFLALSIVYRRLFKKQWQFWGSIAVYAVGLVISDTRATMVAALFVPAGAVVDSFIKKQGGFRWKLLLWFIPIAAAGAIMLWGIARDRNLLTLGSRTLIWKESILQILDNPWGRSPMWGAQPFGMESIGFDAWNCHNVFLNLLMQFSVPAGFCCIMMMLAAFVASFGKNRFFTTLGIWVALLIPLNMDWCMLLSQMPFAFMLLYFIFFHPLRNAVPKNQ